MYSTIDVQYHHMYAEHDLKLGAHQLEDYTMGAHQLEDYTWVRTN